MIAKEKILVIGAEGTIGRALADHLAQQGHSVLRTSRRGNPDVLALDLSGDVSSWNVPANVSIAYLCAAVTSLDECRLHPAQTRAVNVSATVRLAEMLVRQGTFVVFLSSSLVFDGTVPHVRSDALAHPRVEYGRQKADAERLLLQMGNLCSVVRLTKVLGTGHRLLCGWRDALLASKVIRPFSDMVMAPIALGYAVDAIVAVGIRRRSGIVQVSAERDITYAEAARHVARRISESAELVVPSSARDSKIDLEWNPEHTSLDTTALSAECGLHAPDPWRAIDQAIQS